MDNARLAKLTARALIRLEHEGQNTLAATNKFDVDLALALEGHLGVSDCLGDAIKTVGVMVGMQLRVISPPFRQRMYEQLFELIREVANAPVE